jgi:hypothetical protein
MVEVDQAQSLVASADASAALLENGQEQTENLITSCWPGPPAPSHVV